MLSGWRLNGSSAAFGLVLFAAGMSQTAYAQFEDVGDQTASAPSSSSDRTVSPPPAAPPDPEPALAKPEATPPPPAKTDLPAEPPPAPSTAVPVSVEILPDSGYPQPRVRGIVGGEAITEFRAHVKEIQEPAFEHEGPE